MKRVSPLHETEKQYGNEEQEQEHIQLTKPLGKSSISTLTAPDHLSTSSTARQVFDYWRANLKKPRARLDAKRRRAINARLADGYDVETLCRAVDGCKVSTWHQGANERGQKYDDIELICRDAAHVDQFLEIATNGDPRPMSKTTAHNMRALGLAREFLDLTPPDAPKRITDGSEDK